MFFSCTEEGALEYSGPERAFGGKVAWQGYWLAGGERSGL